MHPRTLIVAVAALATGAMTALPAAAETDTQARQLPLRAQVMFNLVDANGDGFIDQTEIAALQRAIFAAIDTDGDGKLSAEEFATIQMGPRGGHRQMMGQMMGRMMQPEGHGWFQRGPQGGEEHQGRHGRMQRQHFEPGQNSGHGGPGGPDNAMMPMPGAVGEGFGGPEGFPLVFGDFASLDADGNGVISIEEFTVAAPVGPSDGR